MRTLFCLLLIVFLTFRPDAVSAEPKGHKPMLATVYSGNADVTSFWVSEKLDGVRAHWDGQALWSRGGYRIASPGWFTAGWPAMAMDGELWLGRGRFAEVSGIVRTAEPDDAHWRQVKFMVFDLPTHGGTFTQRVRAMETLPAVGVNWLQAVPQFRVASADELDARLATLVAAGAEGLMLHHQDARYHAGRSAALLKYKPYEDAEAWVVGYTAGQGKYAGMVGALEVEDEAGRRFRLGSGLSDAERADPPPLGSWVTYRFNGLTRNGLPRFARFLRVREDRLGVTIKSADQNTGG